jgi:hypothetical protein
MGFRKTLVMTAVTLVLALPLAACSSSVRLSSRKMCEASGGTYSGNTCNPAPAGSQKTATQMCQAHGGVYITALDMCEVAGEK